jgi:Tfp pilus assembly protein PilF
MSRRSNRLRARDTATAGGSLHPGGAGGDAPSERAPEDPIETLIRRSRRCRQRGDTRRALVLLREACALDEWRARTWTLLGARLIEAGRRDEAAASFEQARWLRARAGDKARAAVTARLAAQLGRLAA